MDLGVAVAEHKYVPPSLVDVVKNQLSRFNAFRKLKNHCKCGLRQLRVASTSLPIFPSRKKARRADSGKLSAQGREECVGCVRA